MYTRPSAVNATLCDQPHVTCDTKIPSSAWTIVGFKALSKKMGNEEEKRIQSEERGPVHLLGHST